MTISEEVETILKRVGANSKVGEIPSLFAKGHAQDLFDKDYVWGGGALTITAKSHPSARLCPSLIHPLDPSLIK